MRVWLQTHHCLSCIPNTFIFTKHSPMKKVVKAISRILHTSATETSNHLRDWRGSIFIFQERTATMCSTVNYLNTAPSNSNHYSTNYVVFHTTHAPWLASVPDSTGISTVQFAAESPHDSAQCLQTNQPRQPAQPLQSFLRSCELHIWSYLGILMLATLATCTLPLTTIPQSVKDKMHSSW